MKDTIKQIIESNLPEKKDGSLKIPQGNPIDGYSSKTEREKGFNQALSSIDTSLIADEVLKVVVEKIKEIIKKLDKHYEGVERISVDELLEELSEHLSTNKENKNNG